MEAQSKRTKPERRLTAEETEILRRKSFRINRDHWQPRYYEDFLSPGYFEHLVHAYTNMESFVRIHPSIRDRTDEDQNDSGSVPLFRRIDQSGQLKSIDIESDEGLPIAVRISMTIVPSYLAAQLQQEISKMVDQKTTTSEQVDHIRSLLEQLSELASSK